MVECRGLGHSVRRKEDPRFIQGKGHYVDDIKLPGMLYLDIVRSPYAHAKIVKIDPTKALATPGVAAVVTGKDLDKYGLAWMPTLMSDKQMVLPIDTVKYQAQEVAAVVATSRYAAADGVAAVEVEYDPLPVVVDPFKALEKGATKVRDDKESNHIWHWETGDKAKTDKAFKDAEVVVSEASSAHSCRFHRDLRLRRELGTDRGEAHDVHDDPGASCDPHRDRSRRGSSRSLRGKDPGHLPRHRRRVRRQGAGLSRLRHRHRGIGFDRKTGEVDRGPFRKPPGGLIRPRLPHRRRARGEEGRNAHRLRIKTAADGNTDAANPRSSGGYTWRLYDLKAPTRGRWGLPTSLRGALPTAAPSA
jgi:hypothetical protein